MRISFLFLFIVLFSSCQEKAEEKSKNLTYFDLKGYFKNEAKRLSKKNRPIDKTVWINGKSDQKIISIKNWEKELGVFIDADINKGSWKGSFKQIDSTLEKTTVSSNIFKSSRQTENTTTYSSKSNKIPVKKVEIVERDGKVSAIRIFIHNTNDLYTSQDSLSYFPDSLYEIKKVQHIKLMDEKRYKVIGRF